jgi:large subunit ribosomal protein L35
MKEIGFNGADIELRRKRVEPLPYKRRNPSSFR